jgi:tryptophan synthase alpha chain
VARVADGFLYLVSVTGVTGGRSPIGGEIAQVAGRVRETTRIPLYAGFGISDVETARETVKHCDGVIVGSALVRLIKSATSGGEAMEKVGRFLNEVKGVLRD